MPVFCIAAIRGADGHASIDADTDQLSFQTAMWWCASLLTSTQVSMIHP